jgi:hypothetical protein
LIKYQLEFRETQPEKSEFKHDPIEVKPKNSIRSSLNKSLASAISMDGVIGVKSSRNQLMNDNRETKTTKRWFVMSYQSSFSYWWEIFVMVLAIYNSITFPL